MKKLIFIFCVLVTVSAWGQERRLHRLPEVDTVNVVATKSDIDVENPHGGSDLLRDVISDLNQAYDIDNLSVVHRMNFNVGDVIESKNGGRYKVIPADSKIVSSFPDYVARLENGLYLQKIDNDYFISTVAELRARVNDFPIESTVTGKGGSRYRLSTSLPKYRRYSITSRQYTYDVLDTNGTTVQMVSGADYPTENRVYHSSSFHRAYMPTMANEQASTYGHPDPYGGNTSFELSNLVTDESTFIQLMDTEEDSLYYFGMWVYSDDPNMAFEINIRDARISAGGSKLNYFSLPFNIGEWVYFDTTFYASPTTDRITMRVPSSVPLGTKYKLFGSRCISGDKNLGYIETTGRNQIFGDQVKYIIMLPDDQGKMDISWFNEIDYGGDEVSLFEQATVNAYAVGASTITTSQIHEFNRKFELTVPILIDGLRTGSDDDLGGKILLNFDSIQSGVHVNAGVNASNTGLVNIVVEPHENNSVQIDTAVIFEQTYNANIGNLYIDGTEDFEITTGISVRNSTVLNRVERFEIKRCILGADLKNGNSNFLGNGRFNECVTSVVGSGTLFNVGFENHYLPAVFVEDGHSLQIINFLGERGGNPYSQAGINVDSLGGSRPVFDVAAGGELNVIGSNAYSGTLDGGSNHYAYLLKNEGKANIGYIDFKQLGSPVIRGNGSHSTLNNSAIPGLITFRDSTNDKRKIQAVGVSSFFNTDPVMNYPHNYLSLSELDHSHIEGGDIERSDIWNSNFGDSTGTENLYMRSSASNYFDHTVGLDAGSWAWPGFTKTGNYEPADHSAASRTLLVYTDDSRDPPYIRYANNLDPGYYEVFGKFKLVGSASATSITISQVLGYNTSESQRIDSTSDSQYFNILSYVRDSSDRRLDIRFDGSTIGDSIIIEYVGARSVSSPYHHKNHGRWNPEWVPTTGSIVTNPDSRYVFEEDQVIIRGNYPHDFRNGIANVDSLKSQINSITDFSLVQDTDTISVVKGSEISIDGDNVAVSGYTVTLDMSSLQTGSIFQIYIGDATLNNIELKLLSGTNNIVYEGDSAASTKSFSSSYHSLWCRWDGSFLRIDER